MSGYSGIKGSVYIVTGAASGIGRATAVRLASLGASGLALSDVNVAGLEETNKTICSLTPFFFFFLPLSFVILSL